MTSKSFNRTTAVIFVVAVAAYYGMLSLHFDHVRGSYIRAFVVASVVAVAMARGDLFSRWAAAVLSACGAGSAFQLAFYSYPNGETASGLVVPGTAFLLVSTAILASEAVRRLARPHPPKDSPQADVRDSPTTST